MSSDLSPNSTFQQRVFEKIRDQLGDLMTDAELKSIVDKTIDKAFFEPRVVKDGSYYSERTREIESLWVEKVKAALAPRVTAAVDQWVKDHPDLFAKAVDEAIAKGMYELVVQHFRSLTSQPLYELASALKAKGVLQ